MQPQKRNRQKFKAYDKLSYAPDDIASNLYKATQHAFLEAEPINYKVYTPHPLNNNFTVKQRNVQASHLQRRHDCLVFEQKSMNLARKAAEKLVQMYAKYVEPSLTDYHRHAVISQVYLSYQLARKYGRPDLIGLDLPFVADCEAASVVLSSQK